MMQSILRALSMAFAMGWEILWPLILGFALSGMVQAVVSHKQMSRLLPDDRLRSILLALGLGAASSSCSESVRDDASRQRSNRVAEISPEPVDAATGRANLDAMRRIPT